MLLVALVASMGACVRRGGKTDSRLQGTFRRIEGGAGYRLYGLACSPDYCVLPVTFAVKPECKLGMLDVVAFDLRYRNNRNLLLTVEELVPEGPALSIAARTISWRELAIQGFRHEFHIPKLSKPRHLALFICTDETDKRCGNKPDRPLLDAFAQAGAQMKGAAPVAAADRLFFAQYLYFGTSDRVAVAESESAGAAAAPSLAALFGFLDGRAPAGTDLVKNRSRERMKTLYERLLPESFADSTESLLVNLTRRDRACK